VDRFISLLPSSTQNVIHPLCDKHLNIAKCYRSQDDDALKIIESAVSASTSFPHTPHRSLRLSLHFHASINMRTIGLSFPLSKHTSRSKEKSTISRVDSVRQGRGRRPLKSNSIVPDVLACILAFLICTMRVLSEIYIHKYT
jgi:hypothetical protein